jgi:hypothetical protein
MRWTAALNAFAITISDRSLFSDEEDAATTTQAILDVVSSVRSEAPPVR